MGTTWLVQWVAERGSTDASIAKDIQRILDQIVRQMSPWLSSSDISRFNDADAGTWHGLPTDFSEILHCALAVARKTNGAYDPTIGELVDAWGFGPPGARSISPTPAEISEALTRCGWSRLSRRDPSWVQQPGGLRLDLSSIAKGFAVDRIAGLLQARGIANHLVEIGGELRGAGIKPDGEPWWVALEDPFTGQGTRPTSWPECILALHGLAVATSGDSQRHVERGGRRISHTIDPRTGEPVADRVSSVTVIHKRCMEADAWSTALLVMGPDEGLPFAKALGLAARFLLRDHSGISELTTPAFDEMLLEEQTH